MAFCSFFFFYSTYFFHYRIWMGFTCSSHQLWCLDTVWHLLLHSFLYYSNDYKTKKKVKIRNIFTFIADTLIWKEKMVLMHSFEKAILYIFSFIFYPIGIIVWIISLFSKDPERRKIGRVCIYTALVSFILLTTLGIISFYTITTISSS